MELVLLASIFLNGILGTLFFLKFSKKKEARTEPLAVKYYEEIRESFGFFKKEKSLTIKAQLIYGGIPVGQAFTVSESKSVEIDRAQINQTIQDLAQPLMNAGIKAILPHHR